MTTAQIYFEEGRYNVEIADDGVLVFERTYGSQYGAASACLSYGCDMALLMVNGECAYSVDRARLEDVAQHGVSFDGSVEDVY